MPTPTINTDELVEHLNIGVGHAASLLNEIIGKRIQLAVPSLTIYLPDQIHEAQKSFGLDSYAAISQSFSGDLDGSATLLFPDTTAKRFIALVISALGGDASQEDKDELAASTLKEIGNILLNSIMGTIANMKGYQIKIQLPDLRNAPISDILSDLTEHSNIKALIVAESSFTIFGEMIKGNILIMLELSALTALGLEL